MNSQVNLHHNVGEVLPSGLYSICNMELGINSENKITKKSQRNQYNLMLIHVGNCIFYLNSYHSVIICWALICKYTGICAILENGN